MIGVTKLLIVDVEVLHYSFSQAEFQPKAVPESLLTVVLAFKSCGKNVYFSSLVICIYIFLYVCVWGGEGETGETKHG